MKHLLAFSSVVLAVSFGCGRAPDQPVSDLLPLPKGAEVTAYEGMTLVWHDEFDQDGPLSEAWSFEEGFQRNEELQWYQKENASVKEGALVIEARRETLPNPHYQPGSSSWRTSRPVAEYTSSCATTAQSFSFKYGRLEVRAKIPVDKGAWPAIWTLGNQERWPSNGEVDLMEFYRKDEVPGILANACWGGEIPQKAVWDETFMPLSHFTEKDPEWASRYHLWRMDWNDTAIVLSLDGEILNEIDLSETVNRGGDGSWKNPFSNEKADFKAYILLNLAIGSNGGDPSQTTFPLRYYIDYVRVYQAP